MTFLAHTIQILLVVLCCDCSTGLGTAEPQRDAAALCLMLTADSADDRQMNGVICKAALGCIRLH